MADESLPTPSVPSEIDLKAAPAVIAWAGTDGQVHHLHHNERDQVTLDVRFSAASKTAFFKLRVFVKLKDFPHERTPLFLHIHPDCIASLVYEDLVTTPDDIRMKLGTHAAICLRFDLNRPANMIVPRASPLVPRKQKGHGDTLDTLKLLAQRTSLSVYLAHCDSLPEALLRSLGASVADGGLRPPEGAADTAGLYSGIGGEVFQFGDSCLPPSYDGLGVSPPPPPFSKEEPGTAQADSSRKRRRGSSSDMTEDRSGTRTEAMEAACRKVLQDVLSQSRQEMEELQEMRKGVRTEMEELQQLKKDMKAEMTNELRQIKADMMEYVDKRLNRVADELDVYSVEEVDERIEEVRQYNEDRIDVKVEDRVDYVKLELEEYVEDQIAGAQERVLDRLRTASLSLEIQDD